MADIRLTVRIKWRRHTNSHKIGFPYFAEICRSSKLAAMNKPLQVIIGDISYIVTSLIDMIDLLFFNIKANGPESGISKSNSQRQSDIAETYNSCHNFPIGNLNE